MSYGQLARESRSVAAFLKARGVEPGQRIGLLAPNGVAYLPAAFGLLEAGACLVPLPATWRTPRWPRIVRDVQLKRLPRLPGTDATAVLDGAARVQGGECDKSRSAGSIAPPEPRRSSID